MLRQFRSLRKAFALALLLVASLGLAPPVPRQEVTAAITGSVVDSTGARIVDATITAKDTERQTAYSVHANAAGIFYVPRLSVGTHELQVSAPGLQTVMYRAITLILNQTARVDFQLQLGQASETIDV